jgi:hypothetical protein
VPTPPCLQAQVTWHPLRGNWTWFKEVLSPFIRSTQSKTMKNVLLAITVATFFSMGAVAFAQSTDSTAAREAATERYMRAMPMSRMMEDAYSEMSKQMPVEQRASFIAEMRKLVHVDNLERIAKTSMIRHFTADELNALADFYSSKSGASAMAKFGAYMADVMPGLVQEIRRASQELQSTERK